MDKGKKQTEQSASEITLIFYNFQMELSRTIHKLEQAGVPKKEVSANIIAGFAGTLDVTYGVNAIEAISIILEAAKKVRAVGLSQVGKII